MNYFERDQDQMLNDVRRVLQDVNRLHQELSTLNGNIDALEVRADEVGMQAAKYALRDAYVKISQSGQALVEAHVVLNRPPLLSTSDQRAEAIKSDHSG